MDQRTHPTTHDAGPRGPGPRGKRHAPGRRRERGVAALEMALVTPILLLLITGITTIGHAMVVRFMLSSAAYDGARTCALARIPTAKCVNTVVKRKLGGTKKWCNGGSGPKVRAHARKDPAYPAVSYLDVTVSCSYVGVVAAGFLQKNGLTLTKIEARAAMPY